VTVALCARFAASTRRGFGPANTSAPSQSLADNQCHHVRSVLGPRRPPRPNCPPPPASTPEKVLVVLGELLPALKPTRPGAHRGTVALAAPSPPRRPPGAAGNTSTRHPHRRRSGEHRLAGNGERTCQPINRPSQPRHSPATAPAPRAGTRWRSC